MPNFASAVRLNKIPMVGLVPESSGTAPTSPAVGQLWTDTTTANAALLKQWDGDEWIVVNTKSGSTSGTYADGALAEFVSRKNAANGYAGLDGSSLLTFTQIPVGVTSTTVARGDLVERLANKNAVNGYAGLDGSSKLAFSQLPVGTTSTTVAQGDLVELLSRKNAANGYAGVDASSRIAAAQLPSVITAAGSTGATTAVRFVGGSGAAGAPSTGAFLVGDVVVGTDGSLYVNTVAGSPGTWQRLLRANELGAASGIATLDGTSKVTFGQLPIAGSGVSSTTLIVRADDSRLSDTRTPSANTITDAMVTASAAIAESKLALASDAVAGTASRRTLAVGSGAGNAAMPGTARLDQIVAPNTSVDLNSQKIINLGTPTNPNDAARLADVQSAAAGIDVKPSVRAATTTNGTLGTAFANGQVVDGVTLATGDRILLKNQSTASENGPYVVTAGTPTRATDSLSANSFWFVEEGTTQADTSWMITNNGAIVAGTTALTFAQFGAASSYVGTANRITLTGNAFDISTSYVGQASITTVGALTSGSLGSGFTAVGIAQGGTGQTTAPLARTALGVPQVGYAATLGAITAGTPLTVTHGLGTQDVIAQIRDASTNEYLYADIINASTTTVTVTTGINYGASAVRIVVLPVV